MLNDFVYRLVVEDHLLVVASALCRGPRFDSLANKNINLHIFSLFYLAAKQRPLLFQESGILHVFLHSPAKFIV
jgi:hypothetical protein